MPARSKELDPKNWTHGDPWGPHGDPWGPMGTHGDPWGPIGTHDSSWGPMGPHGPPWGPMEYHGNISFFPFLLSMDYLWISKNYPLDFSIDFSMVFPSMDYPWIFHELQNVSVVVAGTPLGVRKQSRHRHIVEGTTHNFIIVFFVVYY